MDTKKAAAALYGGKVDEESKTGVAYRNAAKPAPAAKNLPGPKPAPIATRMYPVGVPAQYVFTVPNDLKHLGLVHDEESHKTFSDTARKMGLSQEKAQELVDLHLRKAYGGKKK